MVFDGFHCRGPLDKKVTTVGSTSPAVVFSINVLQFRFDIDNICRMPCRGFRIVAWSIGNNALIALVVLSRVQSIVHRGHRIVDGFLVPALVIFNSIPVVGHYIYLIYIFNLCIILFLNVNLKYLYILVHMYPWSTTPMVTSTHVQQHPWSPAPMVNNTHGQQHPWSPAPMVNNTHGHQHPCFKLINHIDFICGCI